MADKLFDIVEAAVRKIPHVTIKSAHRNGMPLILLDNAEGPYNHRKEIAYYTDAGQIVIDFERTPPGVFSFLGIRRQGTPLIRLADIKTALVGVAGNPIARDESVLIYERPVELKQGYRTFELVAVGTGTIFGYPNGGPHQQGELRLENFPQVLMPDSIHAKLAYAHKIFFG